LEINLDFLFLDLINLNNNKGVKYMLKQSSSRMKKALAVLLAVLFVASLTAVAVSARGGGGWGGRGGWGGYGGWCMMGESPY